MKMGPPIKPKRLISPGPIADAFMRSTAFICGIVGPVGSGKTMAALQKGLRIAAKQRPVLDETTGISWRKARIGIIRESYPSIESTTLKSWFTIVPETEGEFSWKAPYTHKFRKILRRDEDGRPIEILECEFEFRAIGDAGVEAACRGWEVNAVIIDEADLQPAHLIAFLTGRVGRFNDLDVSLVVDPTIIVVTNMPEIENHIYRLLLDEDAQDMFAGLGDDVRAELDKTLGTRKLVEAFVQPGGMHPQAENIHNLPGGRGYYAIQIAANRHIVGYVDRMVHNKPVPLQYGQPVNANYDHSEHVTDLEWDRSRMLILGCDQGLNAAAVALQRNAAGEIRTLAEVVNVADDGKSLKKFGPSAFGKQVKQMLADRFPGITKDQIRVVLDPAAFAANDREDNEHDWKLAFEKALGFKVHRAKTNSQGLRNEAIWKAQNERGGYQIDRSCKHLRKAHAGGYRYQKQETTTGEKRGHLTIQDTIYTHVADAEQYAALEGEHVIDELRGKDTRGRAKVRAAGGRIDHGQGYFSGR